MTRRDLALMVARTREHQRRVEQAQRIIAEAFAASPSWFVALSGGKDSIAVLSLVRSVRPETPAQFSARAWDLPETREYLGRVENLRMVAWEKAPTDEHPSWQDREAVIAAGARWLTEEELAARGSTRGAPEAGVFLGLRAQENDYRTKHLAAMGTLYQAKQDGIWRCNPIAWWGVLDVWAYILGGDLDYNRAYDVFERLGVPLEEQRIGKFARALHGGSLAIIKRGWPELFNRLAAEHPEARLYA